MSKCNDVVLQNAKFFRLTLTSDLVKAGIFLGSCCEVLQSSHLREEAPHALIFRCEHICKLLKLCLELIFRCQVEIGMWRTTRLKLSLVPHDWCLIWDKIMQPPLLRNFCGYFNPSRGCSDTRKAGGPQPALSSVFRSIDPGIRPSILLGDALWRCSTPMGNHEGNAVSAVAVVHWITSMVAIDRKFRASNQRHQHLRGGYCLLCHVVHNLNFVLPPHDYIVNASV